MNLLDAFDRTESAPSPAAFVHYRMAIPDDAWPCRSSSRPPAPVPAGGDFLREEMWTRVIFWCYVADTVSEMTLKTGTEVRRPNPGTNPMRVRKPMPALEGSEVNRS